MNKYNAPYVEGWLLLFWEFLQIDKELLKKEQLLFKKSENTTTDLKTIDRFLGG